jgi:hypothetical protein
MSLCPLYRAEPIPFIKLDQLPKTTLEMRDIT